MSRDAWDRIVESRPLNAVAAVLFGALDALGFEYVWYDGGGTELRWRGHRLVRSPWGEHWDFNPPRERMLSPLVTFFSTREPPAAGYSIDGSGHLYRNGVFAGRSVTVSWDTGVRGWWIDYIPEHGGPLDRRTW